METIDFKKIPEWWALCPNAQCTMSGQCLRHQVYLQVPAHIKEWSCVLPQNVSEEQCEFFQKAEQVRIARGFKGIWKQIHSRDARHDIRMALTAYFGSKGSYYRYRDGERTITPEQQQHILDILRRMGYHGDASFDEYNEDYVFEYVR